MRSAAFRPTGARNLPSNVREWIGDPRALGWRHAGCGQQPISRARPECAGPMKNFAPDRAVHASRPRYAAVSIYRRRSHGIYQAVERGNPHGQDGWIVVRIRVSRRQYRHEGHHRRRPGRREKGRRATGRKVNDRHDKNSVCDNLHRSRRQRPFGPIILSLAEFDANKPIKLHGVVTKMEWINPHSWIHIDVKGDDGKVVNWAMNVASSKYDVSQGN